MDDLDKTYLKDEYLRLIQEKYPTVQAVATHIINLESILRLPKGTEHFMSDLHGEYEAFYHIMNNCSGVIREKIERLFGDTISRKDRDEFATLIYYPEAILLEKKEKGLIDKDWYLITLHRLVEVCKVVSSKYTRSRVRKALPKYFDYIIDELINMDRDDFDKEAYYNEIFSSIIDLGRAEAFIIAMTELIKNLAVAKLHIVGDVYDRGDHPDKIMDLLINHHDADVQWGNHDIQWMAAHFGNLACMFSVIDISLKYRNISLIEESYGISLRKLSLYAEEVNDVDERFYPVNVNLDNITDEDILIAKIRKVNFMMQLKAEGQIISRHPEYDMDDRNILNNIDFEKGTFNGFKLNNTNFPNVDKNNPLEFTKEEKDIAETLRRSFMLNEKLSRHINFLMSNGSIYKIYNNNLIFHGCVPVNPDGEYMEVCGKKGRDLMDYCDSMVRKAYYAFSNKTVDQDALDFMFYIWCGKGSPIYGREKLTTFERLYIDNPACHKEEKNSYYKWSLKKEFCEKLLKDFGIEGQYSHIINGHIPVKTTKGESPIKADGKLIVIDGGFCKAYHKKTGIAGYTLIYNSHGLKLCVHEPFDSIKKAIELRKDIHSEVTVFETREKRLLVKDTDTGASLKLRIEGLKDLLSEYQNK